MTEAQLSAQNQLFANKMKNRKKTFCKTIIFMVSFQVAGKK